MKFYLGVTNNSWYDYLSIFEPEDVNFWQPGGASIFQLLSPGEPFMFKLKAPRNVIAGVGFFASHTTLPIKSAWDFFSNRNGMPDFSPFLKVIQGYRRDQDPNPTIGCIVLTDPIFFKEEDWIDVTSIWKSSIVQGKSFNTADAVGNQLWQKVYTLINVYMEDRKEETVKDSILLSEPSGPAYGISFMSKVRLGQGSFRVMVTDAYSRKCSITGEKTLPVLEAAHIKPYASSGPHATTNGILLRADIHKLFDNGYITVSNEMKVEVSSKIKEEFQNGREYYQYHGKDLLVLPQHLRNRPAKPYIDWHNTNIYLG